MLLFEARFNVAPNVAALVDAVVLVLAMSPVALVALPPFAAFVVLIAEPVFDEVLPPLDALLLDVELPVVEALPPVAAVELLAVASAAAVLFELCELFSAAFNVAAADFTLL